MVRSRARMLGIKDEMFEKRDIHIHVPDGATPKDGPSAGAAMTTATVSALTGIPYHGEVAMTGDITIRGQVPGIGVRKEKQRRPCQGDNQAGLAGDRGDGSAPQKSAAGEPSGRLRTAIAGKKCGKSRTTTVRHSAPARKTATASLVARRASASNSVVRLAAIKAPNDG